MRINKLDIAVGLIIAFGLFFELAAHADEANQEITITFSAPIQISGQVLPAGTYIFQQADPGADQHLVHEKISKAMTTYNPGRSWDASE
jgi:hypothetical protein